MEETPKRNLRRVIERTPKALYATDNFLGTRMVGVHILEKLECGHVKDAFPECDLLIARYRKCGICASEIAAAPPKKPPVRASLPRSSQSGLRKVGGET